MVFYFYFHLGSPWIGRAEGPPWINWNKGTSFDRVIFASYNSICSSLAHLCVYSYEGKHRQAP